MTDQFEHLPWIGQNYDVGIKGKKICLVGYSHYVDGLDHPWVTNEVTWRVNSGRARYAFFTSVAYAFDLEPKRFFDNVMFFNYVSKSIGTSDQKYESHDPEVELRCSRRFQRLLDTYRPDTTIVFSTKAWNSVARAAGQHTSVYTMGGQWVSQCFLNEHKIIGTLHTQPASADTLRRAVKAAV